MKSMVCYAAIFSVCVVMIGDQTAMAQGPISVQNGYGFGLGVGYGMPNQRCHPGLGGLSPFGGFVISPPREDLPYFAKFPPVHYSGIVPRPYGISPYAAPPGIMPVEMTVPAPTAPAVIKNPFYVPQPLDDAMEVPPTRPASGANESAQQNGRRMKANQASKIGTVQRVTNPFYNAELAWVD